MSDETQPSDTQEAPVEANAQQVQPNQDGQTGPTEQQKSGFQKRINELTAAKYDAERKAQEYEQLVMRMMSERTVASPAPSAPQVEIDPDQKRLMDAYMKPMIDAMQKQQAQIAASAADHQFSSISVNQHPLVAQRARAIWEDVKRQGLHTQGFTPQQALTYAKGELADTLLAEAQAGQAANASQVHNSRGSTPITTQSAVRNPAQVALTEPDMDADPDAAIAFYARQLGDKPVL